MLGTATHVHAIQSNAQGLKLSAQPSYFFVIKLFQGGLFFSTLQAHIGQSLAKNDRASDCTRLSKRISRVPY